MQCSPDYYNSCNTSSNSFSVPANAFGNQSAHSGVAYAGFYTFGTFPSNGNREYIEAPLTSSLVAGRKYAVSFYVSLADKVNYSTNTVGAYFSSPQISGSNCNVLPYTPQILNTSANPLTDKNNWMLISDTLIASGGEQYLTIGNFMKDSLSDTLKLSSTGFSASYYYIDDVSVIDVINIGIEYKNKTDGINVYPNPASETLNIISTNVKLQNAEFRMVDVLGNEIKNEKFNDKIQVDISNFSEGIYFIIVKTLQSVTTRKVIVQH